jgi:hypothetical protein
MLIVAWSLLYESAQQGAGVGIWTWGRHCAAAFSGRYIDLPETKR